MNVLTSPQCPGCRQPFTGVYRGRRGCARCVELGPVVAPKPSVSVVVQLGPTTEPVPPVPA